MRMGSRGRRLISLPKAWVCAAFSGEAEVLCQGKTSICLIRPCGRGPGHQRDTQLVLSQSGYEHCLRDERIRFVDLNRDELIRTPLRSRYMGIRDLWLTRT